MIKKTTGQTYNYAVGRRKTSTAVVKLFKGTGKFNIFNNGKVISLEDYFGGAKYLVEDSLYPFYTLGNSYIKKFDADIIVRGGGIAGQAESIRLALTRALVEYNPEYRSVLKPVGLLKRDPRAKERMKPGLKKARKSPSWSKR